MFQIAMRVVPATQTKCGGVQGLATETATGYSVEAHWPLKAGWPTRRVLDAAPRTTIHRDPTGRPVPAHMSTFPLTAGGVPAIIGALRRQLDAELTADDDTDTDQ